MGELMRRKWDNVEANVSLEKSLAFRFPVGINLDQDKASSYSPRLTGR